MARRLTRGAIPVALGALLLAGPAIAQKPLAEVEVTPEAIRWQPVREYASLTLTIGGKRLDWARTYEGAEAPVVKIESKAGRLADGTYRWELRANPQVSPETRERLAAARKAQDRGLKVDLRELELPEALPIQSGAFTVNKGRFVTAGEREPEPRPQAEGSRIVGDLEVVGNLEVEGKKSFVAADPAVAGGSLVYVALEGPEAGTYLRGSAVTVHGEARIELPGHFAAVTASRGLTVQLTPEGGWSRLYVVEKTPALLVVRDAGGGSGVAFDYLIQGVRRDHADHRVERPSPEN